MKKAKKILLAVLLVLLAAVIGVCYWQRDNLAAIKMSLSHSRENISEMVSANNQKVAEASEKVEGVTVRDMTDEERQALRDGRLSREELIELLTAKEADSAAGTNEAGASQQGSAETAASGESGEDANQKKLSRYLAEIYLMKDEYTAWLEDKYEEAIAEYSALPEDERTATAKYSIGMRCMKEALAKEKECDALMADMEAKISALLTEMGEDTSLVNDIQTAYEEEKALKKAYYLGLHS